MHRRVREEIWPLKSSVDIERKVLHQSSDLDYSLLNCLQESQPFLEINKNDWGSLLTQIGTHGGGTG